MKTQRIPASKRYGVFNPDDPAHVYIGRACYRGGWRLSESRWANPWQVQKNALGQEMRHHALQRYRDRLRTSIARSTSYYLELVDALKGKHLGCFCKPDEACHGDVLVAVCEAGSYEAALAVLDAMRFEMFTGAIYYVEQEMNHADE